MGLNCMDPLTCGFFFNNKYYSTTCSEAVWIHRCRTMYMKGELQVMWEFLLPGRFAPWAPAPLFKGQLYCMYLVGWDLQAWGTESSNVLGSEQWGKGAGASPTKGRPVLGSPQRLPGAMRAAKPPHMEATPEKRVLPAPSEASYLKKNFF